MRAENLARMSLAELKTYASVMGIGLKGAKTAEDAAKIITERRERVATVSALGLDLEIPVKRTRDKRVTDLLQKGDDDSIMAALELVLGKEQLKEVVAASTDEDGTVDIAALGCVVSRVTTDNKLKKF